MRRLLAVPCRAVLTAVMLCAPAAAETPSLRVALLALPAVLDPATALEGPTSAVCRQVYDTLLRYRDGSSDVEPGLATEWAVSRQGRSWTFRIRDGVRLHDGGVLTAHHVAAALQRVLRPGPAAPEPNAAARYLLGGLPGVIREVRAVDSRTVHVELALPYAPLLTALAHPALGIAVPGGATGSSPHLVGTGPFSPLEVSESRIVLGAHHGYWGGPPVAGLVEFVPDSGAIRSAADLEVRGVDIAIPGAAPAAAVGARAVPGWQVGYLALRAERDPLREKKVRQAVAAALDPARISSAVGREAVPLQSLLPPGVAGRREGSPIMLGSPDKARRLLEESGLTGRPAVTVLVTPPDAGGGGPIDHGRLAEAVRASLEAGGFAVQLRSERRDTALAVARGGDHDAIIVDAPVAGGDPHSLLHPLSSAEGIEAGTNLSFYRNPRLDDLLIRGSQLSFIPDRIRVYSRAQAMLADELPWIPLYVRLHWVVARPEVGNLRLHPSGAHPLHRVSPPPPERR